MQINADKTSYMVFTRSLTDFTTRLNINSSMLDKLEEAKIVGVWLTSDMKWTKNTRELTKKAYSRISMLTKLKYVGVTTEDLIDIYVLFIRSVVEYCSVVWHSSLTTELVHSLEMVQKTSLRIILGENYVSYSAALEMCNLNSEHSVPKTRSKVLEFCKEMPGSSSTQKNISNKQEQCKHKAQKQGERFCKFCQNRDIQDVCHSLFTKKTE